MAVPRKGAGDRDVVKLSSPSGSAIHVYREFALRTVGVLAPDHGAVLTSGCTWLFRESVLRVSRMTRDSSRRNGVASRISFSDSLSGPVTIGVGLW
jgi:hypothetical protein